MSQQIPSGPRASPERAGASAGARVPEFPPGSPNMGCGPPLLSPQTSSDAFCTPQTSAATPSTSQTTTSRIQLGKHGVRSAEDEVIIRNADKPPPPSPRQPKSSTCAAMSQQIPSGLRASSERAGASAGARVPEFPPGSPNMGCGPPLLSPQTSSDAFSTPQTSAATPSTSQMTTSRIQLGKHGVRSAEDNAD